MKTGNWSKSEDKTLLDLESRFVNRLEMSNILERSVGAIDRRLKLLWKYSRIANSLDNDVKITVRTLRKLNITDAEISDVLKIQLEILKFII